MLIEPYEEPNLWSAKEEYSLSKAIRAIIFFADVTLPTNC
jgi:hypothetical protein